MERHLSYCDIFANWLRKQLKLGHRSFTHRDILNVTGSNCSYGVLRDLKFKFDFKESKAKSVKEFLDDKTRKLREMYYELLKESASKSHDLQDYYKDYEELGNHLNVTTEGARNVIKFDFKIKGKHYKKCE